MALTPQPGQVVAGKLFSEPMRVETTVQISDGTWRLGLVGTQTEKFRSVTLSATELSSLTILHGWVFVLAEIWKKALELNPNHAYALAMQRQLGGS